MVATLSPGLRRTLQVLGPLLIVLGAAGFAMAIVTMVGLPGQVDSGQGFSGFGLIPLYGFGGVFLFGIGGMLTRLAFLRAGSEIVATETGDAVEYSSNRIGKGLKQAGIGARAIEVVKVKCRKCGFLETEDAKFCSSCGKAV